MYKKINEWKDSKPDSLQKNPLHDLFYSYYAKTGSKGMKFNVFFIIILLAGSYGASFFINGLPQTVQGLIGGFIGIFAGLTLVSLFLTREKQLNNDDRSSFKQLYLPQTRLNQALIGLGISAAIGIIMSVYLPYILGSAFVLMILVFIYFYIIRTPEEIDLYNNGEEDPREIVEREYQEAELEEDNESVALNDEQLNELSTLMSSLTDEQKKLLMNQNNGLVVVEESKKRKSFFKKK